MLRQSTRLRPVVLLVLVIGTAACKPMPPPIDVHHDRLAVYNQTREAWLNVRVVVNHHFGGGTDLLQAGGRLDVPLGRLQTVRGQRFDRSRQAVTRVEVTARTASGEPVRLLWPQHADEPEAQRKNSRP